MLAFIAGYIDGDGSVYKRVRKKNYQYLAFSIVGCTKFLEGMKEYFDLYYLSLTYHGNSRVINKKNISVYFLSSKRVEGIIKDVLSLDLPLLTGKWGGLFR